MAAKHMISELGGGSAGSPGLEPPRTSRDIKPTATRAWRAQDQTQTGEGWVLGQGFLPVLSDGK